MKRQPYILFLLCIAGYISHVGLAYAETSASPKCRFLNAEAGIDACREAVRDIGDIGSYQKLALILDGADRDEEAKQIYEEGLKKYPGNELLRHRYNLFLSVIKEKRMAASASSGVIQQAKSLKYSCLSLPKTLSLTLRKCEEALKLQPNDPEIVAAITQIKSNSSPKTTTAAIKRPPTPPAPKAQKIQKAQQVNQPATTPRIETVSINRPEPAPQPLPTAFKDDRKRFALVIGNGQYKNVTPLKNPVNDATDIAKKLKKLGFQVTLEKNTDRRTMMDAIRDFGDTLYKNTHSIGLFFYAGHGVQVNGKNYFIPVSSNVHAVPDLEYENVPMDRLIDYVAYAGNELNFFIIDACRDNPYRNIARLTRSLGNTRGLASNTNTPTGTLYFYSAKPGQKAADGVSDQRNSPFTSALLKYLGSPDLSIEQIFKKVAIEVNNKTNRSQLPWSEGIITSEFYPAAR